MTREREKNIEIVRNACMEANPRSHEPWEYDSGAPVGSGYIKHTPCRLADVLLATQKHDIGQWWYEQRVIPIVDVWNLRADSLTEQSNDCIQFLADLLT